MSFQLPEEIPGVSVTNFLKYAKNKATANFFPSFQHSYLVLLREESTCSDQHKTEDEDDVANSAPAGQSELRVAAVWMHAKPLQFVSGLREN